ncbi:hypothetical protein [Arthrobacter sp. HLT1-20]
MAIIDRLRPQQGRRLTHVADSATIMAMPTGAVNLQRVDETAALASPETIKSGTWMGKGFDALDAEQQHLWPAQGEAAQRTDRATAEGLAVAATAEATLLDHASSLVESTKRSYDHCRSTLLPWIHRGPHSGLRYWIGWGVLGLGDAVGVAGAAILLGEEFWIACGQALATGLAAVTAGLAGHDLKELRLARQRRRDLDELTDDEKLYRRFFDDTAAGDALLKIVAYLAGAIIILIALGIFSLRASIEGALEGLVFGALAGATALASVINSYVHADEVADLVAVARRDYQREVRTYRRTGRAKPTTLRAKAAENAVSIETEHWLRGQAAARHIQALKYQSLTANPGVVGHGPSDPETPTEPANSSSAGTGPVSHHRRRITTNEEDIS